MLPGLRRVMRTAPPFCQPRPYRPLPSWFRPAQGIHRRRRLRMSTCAAARRPITRRTASPRWAKPGGIGKSEDGQWWVVRINPQTVGLGYGWVSAQYVQASNTASVQTIQNPKTYASIPPAPPPSGGPTATAVDYVNVRTGPSTSYPVLGVASPGAAAEVSGKSADGGWWQVKIATQSSASGFGWVSASYVITQDTGSVPVVERRPRLPTVATTPALPAGRALCGLTDPADGTTFTIDTPFEATWVLQNTALPSGTREKSISATSAQVNDSNAHGCRCHDLTTSVQPGIPTISPQR
jgi:uncharacterized protein YraI